MLKLPFLIGREIEVRLTANAPVARIDGSGNTRGSEETPNRAVDGRNMPLIEIRVLVFLVKKAANPLQPTIPLRLQPRFEGRAFVIAVLVVLNPRVDTVIAAYSTL